MTLCRAMGWSYAELLDLPPDVYDVLVADYNARAGAAVDDDADDED